MRHLVSLVATLLLPALMYAADQTYTLDDPPRYLDVAALKDAKGNSLVDPKDGTIKVESAAALCSKLFDGTNAPKETLDHPFIIHSIVWKNGTQVANGADHWYIYDPRAPQHSAFIEFFLDNSWTQKRFEGTRLYGTTNLTLLYIHQGARGQHDMSLIQNAIENTLNNLKPPDPNAAKNAATAVNKLKNQQQTGYTFADPSGKALTLACSTVLYNGGCIDSQYSQVEYDVTVTKKTPQWLTDIQGAIKIASGQGAQDNSVSIPLEEMTLWQFKDIGKFQATDKALLNPSTLAVSAKVGSGPQASKLSSGSFTNEGRYWGDVSFAVPLNTYKDLSYDDTTSTITPKTVNRENVYVVGDLYFPRIDLSEPQKRLVPHLLAGMPIKKAPLEHLMVGSGIGFNYVEPFAGIAFVRSKQPIAGVTTPTSSSQLYTRVNYKFIWGVNMSVGAITKLLSKNTSSSK